MDFAPDATTQEQEGLPEKDTLAMPLVIEPLRFTDTVDELGPDKDCRDPNSLWRQNHSMFAERRAATNLSPVSVCNPSALADSLGSLLVLSFIINCIMLAFAYKLSLPVHLTSHGTFQLDFRDLFARDLHFSCSEQERAVMTQKAKY